MEAVVLKGPLIDQIKLSCVLTIIMNPLPRDTEHRCFCIRLLLCSVTDHYDIARASNKSFSILRLVKSNRWQINLNFQRESGPSLNIKNINYNHGRERLRPRHAHYL